MLNAVLTPSEDFHTADQTSRSPDEIKRMARYLGIQPTQVVHSRCGGGVAAVVPWFALQFLAPPTVGAPTSPKGIAVPSTTYAAQPRRAVLVTDWQATRGEYPKLFLASGKAAAARVPNGPVVALPYTELLNADSTPKPAAGLWKRIDQAGVPRWPAGILFADVPAEAAVNHYLFRLMGWPDVKVWMN